MRASRQLGRTRRALAAVAAVALALFLADLALALTHAYLPPDLPLERDVQAVAWGPLVPLMDATNFVADVKEVIAWLLASALVFLLTRRGAALVFMGVLASAAEEGLKHLVQRPRPSPGLVRVTDHETSFSFPSGHATFFTWISILVLVALLPRIPRAWRPAAWAAVGAVIAIACLGRVWAGAHWPSDVVGGVLLGGAWAAAVSLVGLRWARQEGPPPVRAE